MTFWVVAVALMVAVVALLAVPLVRRAGVDARGVDRDRSNVALFQDQLAELERDRAQGLLSAEQFEQARIELEQRLLADVRSDSAAGAVRSPGGAGMPWRYAVLACLPVASLLGYLVLGTPEGMDPGVRQPPQSTPEERAANLAQLADRLAQRVAQSPDDTEAWVLLARAHQMLGRHAEAVKAFARAVQLVPNSAQLYADFADVQLGAAEGQWTDEARAAVRKALELDPAHPKAIWLAGTEAFMRRDYAQALVHWEKLPSLVEPGSEAAQVVQNNIAEARKLAAAMPTGAATVTQPAPGPSQAAAGAETIRGTVSLDATLRAEVKPTDAVFVFARAAEGPRMPLAIRRITVQDLPYAFALDDAAAMAPGRTISSVPHVVVGARVSKSGDAVPKPGDLEGFSTPVKPGATGVEVRIGARVQ